MFSSPRNPKSNSVLERSHIFIKDKITRIKAIIPGIDWDELFPPISFAYNITPRMAMKETPFFLYKGRDPYFPTLDKLLHHKIRYYGHDEGKQALDIMHVLYQEAIAELVRARQRDPPPVSQITGGIFKITDLVYLKQHTTSALQPKYKQTYRVIKLVGLKMADISDTTGKIRRANFAQLKKVTHEEHLISQVPPNLKYGRTAKYLTSAIPKVMENSA